MDGFGKSRPKLRGSAARMAQTPGSGGDMDLGAVTCAELALLIGDVSAQVISLAIDEEANRHGKIQVTVLAEEQVKDYIQYEGTGAMSLLYRQSDVMRPLFQGIITWMETRAQGDTYFISMEAKTGSYLMDIERYNLSFQDTAMTTHQLVRQLLDCFPASQAIISIPDEPIGGIAVQYQETIWEFLKRFLSRYQSCLYVESSLMGIFLRAGLPDMEGQPDWDRLPYTVTRTIAPRDLQLPLRGQISYELESSDILPLGMRVILSRQELYVGKIHRSLKDGLLISRYYLYFTEGMKPRPYYNPLLSGISINGVVTDIQRNQVRVRMETDALPEGGNQCYFPFSTVAASPDGSGWYCMPRAGDPVRIFFPSSDEREGYAIANAQGQSSPTPDSPMGNPDLKDITTPDGKTVKFIEGGILLAVGSGKGTVTLAGGKAEIKSAERISIGASEAISIMAGEDSELKLSAGTKVAFISDKGASISITEDTVEAKATTIKNN